VAASSVSNDAARLASARWSGRSHGGDEAGDAGLFASFAIVVSRSVMFRFTSIYRDLLGLINPRMQSGVALETQETRSSNSAGLVLKTKYWRMS
jgi:hypothetical protein